MGGLCIIALLGDSYGCSGKCVDNQIKPLVSTKEKVNKIENERIMDIDRSKGKDRQFELSIK